MDMKQWDEVSDEERDLILKHFREQYEATCELCGRDSEEATEAKEVYKRVLAYPLKDCWEEIECFYTEVKDAIFAGMPATEDLIVMVQKIIMEEG